MISELLKGQVGQRKINEMKTYTLSQEESIRFLNQFKFKTHSDLVNLLKRSYGVSRDRAVELVDKWRVGN